MVTAGDGSRAAQGIAVSAMKDRVVWAGELGERRGVFVLDAEKAVDVKAALAGVDVEADVAAVVVDGW